MPLDGFGTDFVRLLDRKPSGIVLSPSQIEKWDRCKRAWAFEYIGGLRPPPKPSAQLGTDVHTILEHWLMFGTPPNINTKAGRIAYKMIVNLPLPGTGTVERQFWLQTRNGFLYTGKIDWSGIFHGWPTIVDHKTTSDLKYAKTADGLHCDTQGLSYTIAGCLGFEVDELQLLWNYGTTKDRDPVIQPVRTKIRLPIATEKFERVIEPVAAEIVSAKTSRINPHNFPPNALACEDFGGCPHKNICKLTEEERHRSIMTDATPTLAHRLAAMPQGGFAPPQGGGFAPPQGGGFAPPQGGGFAPPGAPQQGGFTPPGAPQQGGYQFPAGGVPATSLPQQGGFTPPGAPQGGFALPQQQGAFHPSTGPNAPESGGAMQQMPTPAQAAAAAEGGETKKRGRGRPRKTESAGEEASAPSVTASSLTPQQAAYIAGVQGFMENEKWDGKLETLIWAGDMAMQAFNARFG